MLITRCRQLPDGEELVWAEETTTAQDGFDPRESALTRRGIALSQRIVRREPRPSVDTARSAPVVTRVKFKVEWQ